MCIKSHFSEWILAVHLTSHRDFWFPTVVCASRPAAAAAAAAAPLSVSLLSSSFVLVAAPAWPSPSGWDHHNPVFGHDRSRSRNPTRMTPFFRNGGSMVQQPKLEATCVLVSCARTGVPIASPPFFLLRHRHRTFHFRQQQQQAARTLAARQPRLLLQQPAPQKGKCPAIKGPIQRKPLPHPHLPPSFLFPSAIDFLFCHPVPTLRQADIARSLFRLVTKLYL